MKIGSILENQSIEKRIAITPEVVKKYISLGFELCLIKNYGIHLGINDEDYLKVGAKILEDEKEIIKNADLILQLGLPSDEKLSHLRENQILVGVLNPFNNKNKIDDLIKKNIKIL